MAVRVVCGLSATMATFEPTRAFSNVDLPAFGRPRIDTNPERKADAPVVSVCSIGSLMCYGLRSADAHLLNAQFVAGQHFNADAVTLDRLARLRHAPQPFGYQAAHGSRLNLLLWTELEHVRQPAQIEVTGNDVAALAVLCDIGIRLVFVADLAQDHFHQVLHRAQTGGVAVLIHHNHHVRVVLLHLAHEIVYRLALGHYADGSHQFSHGPSHAFVLFQLEHVADMHEADDLVDRPFIDGDARILFVDNELAQLLERRLYRDGDDVGPRRHHLAHDFVAELHDRLDQLAVFFLYKP